MPQDPLLWLAGILVVAIVVALAVWAKDKVEFSASGKGLRLRTENNRRPAQSGPNVVVAKGADVGGKVGGIVGVSGTPPGDVGGIDVATNAKIRSGVDKIVGWDVNPERKK